MSCYAKTGFLVSKTMENSVRLWKALTFLNHLIVVFCGSELSVFLHVGRSHILKVVLVVITTFDLGQIT